MLKSCFAKELSSRLVQLFTQNSGNMNPDPWYSALLTPDDDRTPEALERSDKQDHRSPIIGFTHFMEIFGAQLSLGPTQHLREFHKTCQRGHNELAVEG